MLMHGYLLPGFSPPLPSEFLFSVFTSVAGLVPRACRVPMPRACVGAEFGVAWQTLDGGSSFHVDALMDGAVVATSGVLAGASGFVTFPAPIVAPAFAQGSHFSFRLTGDVGPITTAAIQAAYVIRPSVGAPTHTRVQMGVYPGVTVLKAPPFGFDHFEALDGAWNALRVGLSPLATGVLLPIPATLTRFVAQDTVNTLTIDSAIRLWDALAGTPIASQIFAPSEVTTKDSGPLLIPIGAGKVLSVRGDIAPGVGAGSLISPVRATALITL